MGPRRVHGAGARRRGVAQGLPGRHAPQPAGHEGRAEAVAGARRVDFLDPEGGLAAPAVGVVVVGAVGAALDHHRPDPAPEDLRHGRLVRVGVGQQRQLGAARQE